MASEIKVDTISEKTSANGVSIDSVVHKDSAVYPSSADGGALGSASNEWSDLFLADSSVIKFGADQDTTLTHTDGTGLTLNSTNKLCFNDASQFVQGSSATVLSIGATDEIDLTATAIDINGTCDISGTFSLGGTNMTATATELNLLDGGTSVGSSITLADADGFIVNDGGTMKTIPASDISTYAGGGITTASQWRLTTSFTGDKSPIDANWEEVDAPTGFGVMGSSMTESSGIFTFPSTGYWLIGFTFSAFSDNDGAQAYTEGQIYTTTDNSTYAIAANPRINLPGNMYATSSSGFFIQDVTNTSNDKVAFYVTATGNATIIGNTSYNRTYATFLRLGDT
ncbi:hypothetical protein C9439_00725 [archaeon SCG-AAA382B04]|nr:hypothetical protein C9439_00725 [archaeon SCG-AAA382B04]